MRSQGEQRNDERSDEEGLPLRFAEFELDREKEEIIILHKTITR